ncbi:MAG: energy-coupling factor transporter transmembrane component T [Helicobacter sp.]|nr:energy-coupling factor transporter transmembrane component T [Helicobacter sp.]
MKIALRILCLCAFSFLVALSSEVFLSYFAPLLLLLFYKARILIAAFKRVLVLNIFVFFVILSVLLAKNYELATLIFIRSNLILCTAILLFFNTTYAQIASGIYALRLGSKFSYLVFFALKFIYLLKLDLKRLKIALIVRGFVGRTSIFTYKTYANLVGILFILAINRSQNLQKALIARGFNGIFYSFNNFERLGAFEILLIVCTFLAFFRVGILV